MSGLRWRMAVVFLVLAVCIVYVLPNVPGVQSSGLGRFLPGKQINLGLDLKGGIHLTLGVEVDKAVTNALALAGQDLRRVALDEKIVLLRPRVLGDTSLEFVLPKADQRAKLEELLAKQFGQFEYTEPKSGENGQLRYLLTLREAEVTRLKEMAQEQALRTIRNRIDQFGVAEPDIRKQADYRIQVQLPGLSDPSRAVQIIGQTAVLEFHLVRDDIDPHQTVMPAGVISLPFLESEGGSQKLALERDAMLTGEDVSNASPSFDQFNTPMVSLNFNSRGARIFDRVTGENAGRRMAIVLDGKIYSAPVIRERISGGRASISGSFTVASANDLAIVLRAGSLPAPVNILEERTVGPSLGKESIDSGIKAATIGACAVVVFMTLYYGLSGIIANLMLCFTLLLLLAGMTAFGATLTLPGIAGIVLTIGMAVDANVLIYERIREEMRKGLTSLAAVKAGFDRATISITDSNLTTIIATIILYQFGTGPIRGFAVTLSLGILGSMFTAIFVSRCIFEYWARRAGSKGISI